MKKKYRALRTVAFIMQVLAWLALILTLLGSIGGLVAGILGWVSIPAISGLSGVSPTLVGIITGVVSGFAILMTGIINFIVLLAGAETIFATLDIEHNTRLTADLLKRVLELSGPAPSPSVPSQQSIAYTGGETVTQDTPAG